jgi:hypothetical protein
MEQRSEDTAESLAALSKLKRLSNIIFEKLACFSVPQNTRLTHRDNDAIHHNFTTQTPPLRTAFCKTTLKNITESRAFPPATTPAFFPET